MKIDLFLKILPRFLELDQNLWYLNKIGNIRPKLGKFDQNYVNFPNSLEFDQNWWNLTKIDEIWPKLMKLDQNLWILPKVLTFTKIYEIWPKWIKLGKHWWILIKKVKITQNRLNSHSFWVTVIHNFLRGSENVSRWPCFVEIKLRKC